MAESRVSEIQDVAENFVRKGGYKAFSFREIAKHVGIKSASIHYHFPTKEDLAVAIAKRYTDRFNEALLGISESDKQITLVAGIEGFIALFRTALIDDGRMCLCGALAVEADDLPVKVRAEARRFFEQNLAWLTHLFMNSLFSEMSERQAQQQSCRILAMLEGAMMIAQILEDHSQFELIAESIVQDYSRSDS